MCHDAEQEIIFIDPLHIKLRLRPFQRTVQHNVVCCAQFQIRQILCCCVFLFTLVVFDSDFLLLFIVFFLFGLFLSVTVTYSESLSGVNKFSLNSHSNVFLWYPRNHSCHFSTSYNHYYSYSFWQCNKLCCIRFSHRTVKTMETVQREWQLWQCNYFQQEKEMKHNEGATICKKCLDPQCY